MSATGNNLTSDNILSIRLGADGLSFLIQRGSLANAAELVDSPASEFVAEPSETLCDMLEKLRITGRISFSQLGGALVEVDTDRLVLIPLEAFEEGMQEDYLALNNIVRTPHDEVVTTTAAPGVIALVVLPRDVAEFFHRIWDEGHVRFASPIARCLQHGLRATMRIFLARDFAYIALYGDRLEYAVALPYGSPADLLYYLGERDLRRTRIEIAGRGSALAAKQLRKYYRRVREGAWGSHAHR